MLEILVGTHMLLDKDTATVEHYTLSLLGVPSELLAYWEYISAGRIREDVHLGVSGQQFTPANLCADPYKNAYFS